MSKRRGLFGSKKIRPVVPPLQKEDEEPQTHFLISGLGAMDFSSSSSSAIKKFKIDGNTKPASHHVPRQRLGVLQDRA
jgi:hypothetical protein